MKAKGRERALEVAREWLIEWTDLSADEQEVPALADLLLAAEASARLDEARDWMVVVKSAVTSRSEGTKRRCMIEGEQRVADLERAAKGTEAETKPAKGEM